MVAVHPPLVAYLSQERADQLAVAGLFADDPSEMAIAWPRLGGIRGLAPDGPAPVRTSGRKVWDSNPR
jgi:hypothetical protein